MKTHALRLQRGQDLRMEIDSFVESTNIKAGVLLTCVGSLQKARLRMAEAKEVKVFDEAYEIVSLTGTVGAGGSHIHISISDKEGHVYGGHLKDNSIVDTTAEIVIGELPDTLFSREPDSVTGYDELVIKRK